MKKENIAICSAAVADFKPVSVLDQKIKKKTGEGLSFDLEPTKDILASLGLQKKNQFLVGFALETQNEIENSKKKLEKKNLDLIVLNSLRDKGAGFKGDTNKVTFIDKDNKVTPFDVKSGSARNRHGPINKMAARCFILEVTLPMRSSFAPNIVMSI